MHQRLTNEVIDRAVMQLPEAHRQKSGTSIAAGLRARRDTPECPIYSELRRLLLKTAGLADTLRAALSHIRGITLAFIYGSVAQGTDDARSDVDVLIVTDGALRDASEALFSAQKRLEREISPTVYSVGELRQKIRTKHHFLSRILQEPQIMLVGDIDDIARVGGRTATVSSETKSFHV